MKPASSTWPKRLPELTPEQSAIRDDFLKYWHEILTPRYGLLNRFNHAYPLRTAGAGGRTLDIGAGLGEHIEHEDTSSQLYVALELRPEMAAVIASNHPDVQTIAGDLQAGLDFESGSFDRALAIHVLEHLPDLPAALDEVHRLLRPGGALSVVIPCEGGLAYWLARRISAQRIFEKRYGMSYDWFIKSEHINVPREIVAELDERFVRTHRRWFPLPLPSVNGNLVIGLTYRKA